MLFMIDIGYNGGRRSYSMYRKAEWKNFARCYEGQNALGIWNVDAFIQKHTAARADFRSEVLQVRYDPCSGLLGKLTLLDRHI